MNLEKGYEAFPVLIIDRDSYIVEAKVETGLDFNPGEGVYNLQIGKYSSLAEDILFLINVEHNFKAVYQGTISLWNKNNEKRITSRKGQIIIENDCWIGHGSTILNGVTIHNGAIVAANAVVTKDVPPYAIVAGNPARVVKYRFDEKTIERFLKIEWWNWDDDTILGCKEDFALPGEEFAAKYAPIFEEEKNDYSYNINRASKEEEANLFLFFVDYEETISIVEKVIAKFVLAYHNFDGELILYLPENKTNYSEQLDKLFNFLNQFEKFNSYISICSEPAVKEESLISQVDFYITNHASQNVARMSTAHKHGVKCLSGVDTKVF